MESALTTVPPQRRAIAIASADLPLAVGPAMSTALIVTLPGPSTCSSPRSFRPCQALVDDSLLSHLFATIPGLARSVRLDGEIAADVFAEADDARKLEAEIRLALAGGAIDIVVQPEATRRKALFLADMDSTMIGQECIDELAAYVGLKEKVSGITERAMRGEIAFEPALREACRLAEGRAAFGRRRDHH